MIWCLASKQRETDLIAQMVLSGTCNFNLQHEDKTETWWNEPVISVFTNTIHYSDSPRKLSSKKLSSIKKHTKKNAILRLCRILTKLLEWWEMSGETLT